MTLALLLALLNATPCEGAISDLTDLRSRAQQLDVPLLRTDEATWTFEHVQPRAEYRLKLACGLRAQPALGANRVALDNILAREEFADSRGNAFHVLGQLIGRWLERFFRSSGVVGFAEVTRVVVLVLAFALLVGGGLRLWSTRRRGALGPPPLPPPSLLRPSPEHLANARAALVSAPREALRESLLALLSALERNRLARPDRVRTNRELAAELPKRGAAPEVTTRVQTLMGEFDQTYYSLEPVGTDRARAFLNEIEKLDRDLGGPTP